MLRNAGSGAWCEDLWHSAGQASVSASKQSLHVCRWERCPELKELQLFRCEKRTGDRRDPMYSFSGYTAIFSCPAKILTEFKVTQARLHAGQSGCKAPRGDQQKRYVHGQVAEPCSAS